MVLVSACLAGERCRYDGGSNPVDAVVEMARRGEVVAVCPEVLGGLPTPRVPSELRDGRVVNAEGADVTDAFVRGAARAREIAREHGCRTAILKSRSPSCGCGAVYDGSFQGRLREGNGVFADLLMADGMSVMTEEDL